MRYDITVIKSNADLGFGCHWNMILQDEKGNPQLAKPDINFANVLKSFLQILNKVDFTQHQVYLEKRKIQSAKDFEDLVNEANFSV